jgi:ketosteroid isomerase-like protein
MAHDELLMAMYAAFNARDIDLVLAHLHPDVDWPNAWEGGRVHGHDEVRDYWTRQWKAIDGTVEPAGFEADGDRVTVLVDQTVRDLDGNVVSEGRVRHVYEFRDGLVIRMDVED